MCVSPAVSHPLSGTSHTFPSLTNACVTLLLLQEQALRFGQTFVHNKTSLSQADPRLNFESDVNLLPCMGMKEIHSQPFLIQEDSHFVCKLHPSRKKRERMLLMHCHNSRITLHFDTLPPVPPSHPSLSDRPLQPLIPPIALQVRLLLLVLLVQAGTRSLSFRILIPSFFFSCKIRW